MSELTFGIQGEFTVSVIGPDGQVKESSTTKNLILDNLLEAIRAKSDASSIYYSTQTFRVGTGTTPPTASDLTLQSTLASRAVSSTPTQVAITSDGTNWRTESTIQTDFSVGAVVGNITELGWFVAGMKPNTLTNEVYSRTLIKDSQGNPTTLTVTSTDVLRVSYKLVMTGPDADVTGTLTLAGNSYNYTIRRPTPSVVAVWAFLDGSSASSNAAYVGGTFGAAGQNPSGGTLLTATALVEQGASAGERRFTITVPTNVNGSAGISMILLGNYMKIQFSPAVPKTTDDALKLLVNYTIART